MDLRRLRAGEWLLTAASVALLVSLFLPWYSRSGHDVSGWGSFAVVDVVLAFVAVFALLAVAGAATQPTTAVSISLESLTVILGLVASVIALVEALGHDAAGGAFLGLAASLGIFATSLMAIRDERLSPPGRHTDMTGRPVPPPPEIEALPPPEGSA